MKTTLSTPHDEQALITAATRGDLEAFNILILRYQDMLFNVAARFFGDDDQADDAVQEALISAFRSLRTFSGGSFRAWLTRTLINKCYDEFRRTSRHPTLPLVPTVDGEEAEDWDWLSDPSLPLEDQVEVVQLNEAIQRGMNSLPPSYRTVLALVDVEGLPYDEAANALKVPVGTVKSRLARARAALRQQLRSFADVLPLQFQMNLPASIA